jgi:FAD synthetase
MTDLSEDPSERARKYITGFEQTLQELTPKKHDSSVKAENITKVEDAIQRYLKDAHYYLKNNKPTTSLASIAYAEGLLDALMFLDLLKAGIMK